MTPLRATRRFISRISFRLMAFNLLLVFLPVAGILYLDSYESKLLGAQRRTLEEEARLLSAAVSSSRDPSKAAAQILLQRHRLRKDTNGSLRLRVMSTEGRIIADSHQISGPPPTPRSNQVKRNMLYRVGAMLLKPILRASRATEPALREGDFYERSEQLMGEEVQKALKGKWGRIERISPDRRSVTVYVAVPIRVGDRVIGASLASQSTFTILQDLYIVRLGILRIFVVSLLLAVIISFLIATTIVQPLRKLRFDARAILDARGRLRGRFKGSRSQDEIGDLSRALERLTRRLDEHVRFIESFAADVSHEFRNPLASIRTATEMLAEVDEPLQRSRFLRMVESEIARMESLLSGVRDITLIDARLTTEPRRIVSISTLLTAIVEGFQLREKSRVDIRLELPAGPCDVSASEERLIEVFVNVLENAISFSSTGTVVTINVRREGAMIISTISDQGPGIPDENVEKVFDRFFTHRPHGDAARNTHTGLGLAIVKAIVEGYGGTISATNNSDRGATFLIRLPAA